MKITFQAQQVQTIYLGQTKQLWLEAPNTKQKKYKYQDLEWWIQARSREETNLANFSIMNKNNVLIRPAKITT